MQAGGGGRRKLSVVSSQFLVKGGKRFFCGGLGKLRLGAQGWTGRIVHSAGVRRNAESSYGRPSTLSRGADEIPLAPGERFVHRQKMSAGNVLDEFGLAEPLLVGAAFELNHGGQRIHLVRNAAREGIFGNL